MVYAIGFAPSGFGRGAVRAPADCADAAVRGRAAPPFVNRPDEGLPTIAAATGGGYFELTSANDLAATFARVADELHHQYALGFTPSSLDGKMHSLEVQVSGAGMKARARKSYLARGHQIDLAACFSDTLLWRSAPRRAAPAVSLGALFLALPVRRSALAGARAARHRRGSTYSRARPP